jgi:hypothetical protein
MVSDISLKAMAETVARAGACPEPDSIEIAMLAMMATAAEAIREITWARNCGHAPNRDRVRRPLVDVAAAALLIVTRIDAGDWCDVRNTQGGETDE